MTLLLAGMLLFFGTHFFSAFRARTPGDRIEDRMGATPYLIGYSLVSLAGLVLMVMGYRAMPYAPFVFNGIPGASALNALFMLPAMILIVAFKLPMSHIKSWVQHPMVVAVIIWAAAHLVDGASLRQLLLFGGFLVFGVIDLIASLRRPVAADRDVPVPAWRFDLIALIGGLVLYAVFVIWLHRWLFGFAPFG